MIRDEVQVGLDRVVVGAAFLAAIALAVVGWVTGLEPLTYCALVAFMLAFALLAIFENARSNRRTQALLRVLRAEAEARSNSGLREARSL